MNMWTQSFGETCQEKRQSGKRQFTLNLTFEQFSPSVVRTYRNGYHNLSTSGTTPAGAKKQVYMRI